MSNPISDPGLTRQEVQTVKDVLIAWRSDCEKESSGYVSKRLNAAIDKLRAALSAPQEEGEGKSSGVESAIIEQARRLVSAYREEYAAEDEEGKRTQQELDSLSDLFSSQPDTCRGCGAEIGRRHEGDCTLRPRLILVRSLDCQPASTQQSVPEHSGEGER